MEVPCAFTFASLGGVVAVAEGASVAGVVGVEAGCDEFPFRVGVVIGVQCAAGGVAVIAACECAGVVVALEHCGAKVDAVSV